MAAAPARLGQIARSTGLLVLAIPFALLLSSTFDIAWVPIWVPLVLTAIAVLAAVRPSEALLVVAALTPVARYTGARWNGGVSWAETIVVAFAAGWLLHLALRPSRPGAPSSLVRPALLFAAVVGAAVLVELAVFQMRLETGGLASALWEHFTREYFFSSRAFRALHTGALLLEGLILLLAAAEASASIPGFRRRAAMMLAIGASAAAAINLLRLAEVAMRADDPLTAFGHYLMTQRINVHHADPNAAGSFFAMMLFVAAALAYTAGRTRLAWAASAVVLTFGLWITGSRAAVLCGVAAAAIVPLTRYGGSLRRSAVVWVAAVIIVAGGVLAIAYAPMRGNQRGLSDALATRSGLASTSFRMLRESPLFGIGLGDFYERSGEFSSPELLRLFPAAIHENAHNNYLQIMAEQGLLGLAAFVWTLAAAALPALRRLRDPDADALAWGLAGGVVTFLLTCVGGHPLLIAAPGFAFWMLLGVAGGASATATSIGNHTVRYVTLAAVLVIAVSIVPRANAQRRDANLEHVGIGVSGWQMSEDGVRYRWADGHAILFVPGRTAGCVVKLRSTGEGVQVELGLDGRAGNVVHVAADRWTDVRMFLPRTNRAAQFRRLDVRIVSGAADGGDRLMIGRVDPF
jgi:O-antigen ligase